jgi:serine/threonine-protein kinase 24/25/MST4
MSPEVIEGNPYDFKADIWSLGITVIEIAQSRLPFGDANVMRVSDLCMLLMDIDT